MQRDLIQRLDGVAVGMELAENTENVKVVEVAKAFQRIIMGEAVLVYAVYGSEHRIKTKNLATSVS